MKTGYELMCELAGDTGGCFRAPVISGRHRGCQLCFASNMQNNNYSNNNNNNRHSNSNKNNFNDDDVNGKEEFRTKRYPCLHYPCNEGLGTAGRTSEDGRTDCHQY